MTVRRADWYEGAVTSSIRVDLCLTGTSTPLSLALFDLTFRRTNKMRPHFRFEDLEIWQIARKLAVRLHELANELEKRRYYRYAEQLRAAGLSLTNNIAEGSASIHPQEFRQFLNISRRSLFEDASMLMVFEALG